MLSGTKYKSFPKIEADNLKSLNADEFVSWLERHKQFSNKCSFANGQEKGWAGQAG